MEKRAAVFCSSVQSIDPACHEAAREVTRILCEDGWTVVSGGSWRGTMGAVAEEAFRCGGRHVGVLPHFLAPYAFDRLSELIMTDTMAERKQKMREGTSLAIALPGGIGTLDELIETLVLAKLGQYGGRIAALNFRGFFEPVKALLQHYVDTGMTRAEDCGLVYFADSVEDLAQWIRKDG